MQAHIGGVVEPVERLCIEVGEVREAAAIEKAVFQIIDAALDFAFSTRAIRLMRFDGEAIVIGEVQQLRV